MFIKNLKKLTIAALAVACMIPAGVSSANVENVTRIAGEDRIATSIEISKAMFNESDNVVLASGYNFADALSAGQLAAALNAPLILSSDQLDSRTSDEIAKLKPKNIYIVGGETALSSNIE
ncbi:MAG: cell wall-binding repeat-containing protein, partial [Finegoldia magna]|nr:cell wall-binding repeat-containing protein [Finegoldia magna]